jgi:hypothetical protein
MTNPRTPEHKARLTRLQALLKQAIRGGHTLSMIARSAGVSLPSIYGFRSHKSLSPQNTALLEKTLLSLLGGGGVAHASPPDDNVLRSGLQTELSAKYGGIVPKLARELGTTAHDLRHALGGGAFSSELETAARRLLGLEIGNHFAAPALPEGATVEERARRLFDAWGLRAIAIVLAKAGKKAE